LLLEDKNAVQHHWWLPKPNRTDCLAHFVKECLANGRNPMEILHSSAKSCSSSSKEEEIAIWKRYITTTSNQIDIDLLPKEVHNLHQGSHRSVSEKLFNNEKARIRMVNSKETSDTKQPIITSVESRNRLKDEKARKRKGNSKDTSLEK
jgi:hypothetical protein